MLAHDFFSAEMREGSRERFLGSERETEIFGILTNSIRFEIAVDLQGKSVNDKIKFIAVLSGTWCMMTQFRLSRQQRNEEGFK